jgi:SagB-type dehydrogenase family enzyme
MSGTVKMLFALTAVAAMLAAALVATRSERIQSMQSGTRPVLAPLTIHLPKPCEESATSIEKALRQRRSVREYGKEPVLLEEIAQLLWAAQGITHGKIFRTAPSAGALYPLETYVVAGDVRNLPAGVYRYLSHRHELALVLSGDVRGQLSGAALHQDSVGAAPAVIVFSAVFTRTTGKYGKRGIRYAHMEAGGAAQNVALQAVSLGLGTVMIGAFDDDAVHGALSLPTEEEPMLIMPVGRER